MRRRDTIKHNLFFAVCIISLSLFVGLAFGGEKTTVTTKIITNEDGTQTVVEETTTTETTAETEQASESESVEGRDDPNIVGPTGATGTIRRSDRRQDRRAGDPRID